MVEATGDANFDALQAQADNLAAEGNQQPGLVGLFYGFRARTPQLYADMDRTKVKTMGVATDRRLRRAAGVPGQLLRQRLQPLRPHLAGQRPGRRPLPHGRGGHQATQGPQRRRRHGAAGRGGRGPRLRRAGARSSATTCFRRPPSTAPALPGVSTGDVLATMETLAQKLPRTMTYEWTELSYLQKQSSKIEQFRDLQQNPFSAFVLGVVLVFFVLAGLYESWSLPLAVILVVPMCLLNALAGVALARMDVNIFVQVGFVVLVGLAAKNAILIVEFARDRQQEGASRFDAAVEAARVRLRPILMTSFAFILGVFPLVIARGAGAEMRRTLGTAVFAGMIGVTLFGIFLTPVFFYVIRRFSGPPNPASQPAHEADPTKDAVHSAEETSSES